MYAGKAVVVAPVVRHWITNPASNPKRLFSFFFKIYCKNCCYLYESEQRSNFELLVILLHNKITISLNEILEQSKKANDTYRYLLKLQSIDQELSQID